MAFGPGQRVGELPIPQQASKGGDSSEVLRVWLVGESTQFVLRPVWEDPAAWGVLLADLARHIAAA